MDINKNSNDASGEITPRLIQRCRIKPKYRAEKRLLA